MRSNVLVIGSGSFIAKHWRQISSLDQRHVDRHGVADLSTAPVDVVVNCATSPDFKATTYDEALDLDLRAARLASKHGAHFVMLSTRKVYAQSKTLVALDEESTLGPSDQYGSNKLESERRIQALLGDRCTILRIANVFGFELGRRSFFGLAMTKLKHEKRIVLDVSPFTARDFISAHHLGRILDGICAKRPSGIVNVGSGHALQLGRIAQWLIEGYGAGALEVIDVAERDAFVMNVAKLDSIVGTGFSSHDFESNIRLIGKQLTDE